MIEKHIGCNRRGHYMNWSDIWEEVECPLDKSETDYCMELAKNNSGIRFRVRSIFNSSIKMDIVL